MARATIALKPTASSKPWTEGRYARLWATAGNQRRKMLEHRFVWEQEVGPIPSGMSIHHRNGNSLDNRLENLQMMPLGEHIRSHKKGRPLSAATTAARLAVQRGKPLAPEHREKISQALIGHSPHLFTDEQRRRMSDSARRRANTEEGRRHMRYAGMRSARTHHGTC